MSRALSIATWNCFGMAQGALDVLIAARAFRGARLRHEQVKQALETPDIVCIQEVMSGDAEALFDGLGVERVRDVNGARLWPFTMRGSGLGIAGRLRLGDHCTTTFESPGAGWDRFARKGTQYARVRLDDVEVDVVNVHLQSGYDTQAAATRAAQIAEVAARVHQLGSDHRLFVVCGDFNVCGLGAAGTAYTSLRRALTGFDDVGATDDLPTYDPHPEHNGLAYLLEPSAPSQRLDYIFVRPPRASAVPVRICDVSRILDRPLEPDSGAPLYASDHFGLQVTIEIG